LQVSLTDPTDANVINKTEITDNITNECGRTMLAGNIDIGATTEDVLANKTVTSVTKGSMVAVTINQGGAMGAGPFTCDLDLTSNANGASGQIPLNNTETDSADGKINLAVTLPTDMACFGGSPGNVCTVRCINKQNYGGCFAVQQTDITPANNQAATIKTAATLASIYSQVMKDNVDLPVAIKANAMAKTEDQKGMFAAQALVQNNVKAGGKRRRGLRFSS